SLRLSSLTLFDRESLPERPIEMIGWGDVYRVAAAMAPLYFALGLGYGSVRWWKLFTPDHGDAVNRLVVYFAFPLFGFDFTARAGSFAAGYRVLAADAVAKLIV
uniref:Uncharacterized protein n=1 Tax=Aegilops tauschii subsp. strangulata TaxID=200361 RepID=A0A453L7Z9_AEGTS